MKPLAIVIAAGTLMAGSAGTALAHTALSFGISYGPGPYWGYPGYYRPYYAPRYAYPGYFYPRYYFGPPAYYAYAYPPPPRVVYVPRYAEVAPTRTPHQRAPEPPAPQAAIPPQKIEKLTLSATELFEFDRANLYLPQPKLDEIAKALNENPGIANVTITGYTDRLGTEAYNNRLSQKRAEAVKSYLVAKGVAANRLTAVGRGEANAVVQCDQKEQAALIKCLEPNRRVEVEQITVEKRSAPQG